MEVDCPRSQTSSWILLDLPGTPCDPGIESKLSIDAELPGSHEQQRRVADPQFHRVRSRHHQRSAVAEVVHADHEHREDQKRRGGTDEQTDQETEAAHCLGQGPLSPQKTGANVMPRYAIARPISSQRSGPPASCQMPRRKSEVNPSPTRRITWPVSAYLSKNVNTSRFPWCHSGPVGGASQRRRPIPHRPYSKVYRNFTPYVAKLFRDRCWLTMPSSCTSSCG